MSPTRRHRIYRVTWKREKWTCQRAKYFGLRKTAEAWIARVEKAWPDGDNPLEWIALDSMFGLWQAEPASTHTIDLDHEDHVST